MTRIRTIHALIGLGFTSLASPPAQATPFTECPTPAFLVQKNVAEMFGVNLATGYYQTLASNMGTSGKLNAMGFSLHDNYMYGWSREHNTLVKINAAYQIEPLTLSGDAPNLSFFVGDVALAENAHYLYMRGAGKGLYRVSLEQSEPGYLQWQKLVDGSALNLAIFDFAFHPDRHELYSVDNAGRLWLIDPATGNAESLGNVGQSGTFGAVYFDVEGTLYISRNQDGLIFRVDVDAAAPVAELFAQGPASSNNDGARCAIAPIVDPSTANIDFGDAPASYGTLLTDNGARHQLVEGGIQLGAHVDGEADAKVHPQSDDVGFWYDDEDGVIFISPLQAGADFLIILQATASGYASGWFDTNGNGQFDDNEQLLTDTEVVAGDNVLLLTVPEDAVEGETWARIRVASVSGLAATGGAPDGEVEDHAVFISDQDTQVSFYPGLQQQATVAFEDNWPMTGDYDLNDLVVRFQSRQISDANNNMVRLELEGEVVAMGASFHNGLAFRLPGVASNSIDQSLIRFEINGQLQSDSPLELGTDDATIVLASDLKPYFADSSTCAFYRTERDCTGAGQFSFSIRIPFVEGLNLADFPAAPYDPFIFAAELSRDPALLNGPHRGLEIHLKNQQPTRLADINLWNVLDDFSNPSSGLYYQSANGMPWAIVIPYPWQHPAERVDVSAAYPMFAEFAQSSGATNSNWYLPANAKTELLYSAEGEAQ
ncbi:LruC domain-containing protein [Neiella marina]|uniref:LruC domain-containing protein n=1 Tax=Neiella holothuriorum TaxID=2870530 RepID=A0ABS7EJF9_9GAMM|nr:LruC domain-containing protein [Neiella holothuriorum]MBW8192492.1 LruC domain-containing protein [Neiella holothuriorum]